MSDGFPLPSHPPAMKRVPPFAAVGLAVLAASGARACPVPVYQYSLEHWKTDSYEAVVHAGETLSEDQLAAVACLESSAGGGEGAANLDLRREAGASGAARIELFYPKATGIRAPVWTGDLSLATARALVASPLRERVGKALAERTSAVWILLESGDKAADDAAENTLRRELERAAKTLVIPETAEWGGETVKIDHKVNFKILRLGRGDPAETVLVEMLLASEPDLKSDFNDQPMAFPVYGRGLVLYALVGKGINASTIRSATEFLAGPCSCQIKAGNPGTDLLLAVDWEKVVETTTPETVGGTTGAGGFLQKLDEAGKPGERAKE